MGLCSVLMCGCPIRQTVLSGEGEGDADASITVIGLIIWAAFAHNFGLASSGEGITTNGMIAVVIGLIVACIIGFSSRRENIWNM